MAEITVRIHHNWLDNEEGLMKRIARIITYDDQGCKQKDSGYKWALDERGNDWWASGIESEGKNHTIKVAYRYGGGGNAKVMEALKTFLEWELGPSNLEG